MQRHFQHATTARGLPEGAACWLRVLSIVCLLLVVVMSTVQVCHIHSGTASVVKQGTRPGDPARDSGTDDHCPLCVAMHSALPTDIHVAPEPLGSVRTLDSVAADVARMFRWRFEMASRPPPASFPHA